MSLVGGFLHHHHHHHHHHHQQQQNQHQHQQLQHQVHGHQQPTAVHHGHGGMHDESTLSVDGTVYVTTGGSYYQTSPPPPSTTTMTTNTGRYESGSNDLLRHHDQSAYFPMSSSPPSPSSWTYDIGQPNTTSADVQLINASSIGLETSDYHQALLVGEMHVQCSESDSLANMRMITAYENNNNNGGDGDDHNDNENVGGNGRVCCDIGINDQQQVMQQVTTVAPVRTVKRRYTANRKERRRTLSINNAFADLRDCIPNVPADTKLSKIKTLRLATSYIAYLMDILAKDDPSLVPEGGFKAEVNKKIETREEKKKREMASLLGSTATEKRTKGRTGWPQHVWALELKQ